MTIPRKARSRALRSASASRVGEPVKPPLPFSKIKNEVPTHSEPKEKTPMKLRIASLFLLAVCLTLAAVPAMAQSDLYDNGPVNDNQNAWTINFGFSVTDTIQVNGTVQGLDFWALLIPVTSPPASKSRLAHRHSATICLIKLST